MKLITNLFDLIGSVPDIDGLIFAIASVIVRELGLGTAEKEDLEVVGRVAVLVVVRAERDETAADAGRTRADEGRVDLAVRGHARAHHRARLVVEAFAGRVAVRAGDVVIRVHFGQPARVAL